MNDTCIDNSFDIRDSNQQDEDQHLVQENNVDDDRLINQKEIANNVPTEVNANLNNINIDDTLDIVNNGINS